MSVRPVHTSFPAAHAVVAAWLIAVQVLLTASVGAMVCGMGNAAVPEPLSVVPSGPMPIENDYATLALAAAEDTAATIDGFDLDAAVLDLTTGVLASDLTASAPMYAASLAKLVVAVDVIDRRRDEGLVVGDEDLELIRRALGPSDDAAMNELWTRFDGQGAAARVSPRLGLTATAAPTDPSYWGQMTITAADLTTLYRHVLMMPEADRDLIIGAIAAAPAVATDGFAQDFGLLAPRSVGTAVAKQGWMCCDDQTSYLHSAGLVGDDGRFVVVLLSRQQFVDDWQPERERLTTVAGAVHEVLDPAASIAD